MIIHIPLWFIGIICGIIIVIILFFAIMGFLFLKIFKDGFKY
jgi:hypothetical protein